MTYVPFPKFNASGYATPYLMTHGRLGIPHRHQDRMMARVTVGAAIDIGYERFVA